MRLVLGRDEEVAAFAAEGLQTKFVPPFVAFGIVDEAGALCGAMVFNHFNGFNMEVSMFTPGCFRRRFLKAGLDYVFHQAGCIRLTARTRRRNKALCRSLPKLGFVFEGVMKSYFGPRKGDDAIVFRMTAAEAARWIGEPHE